MNKSITILCNNRFNYLKILCDSLAKNDLSGWNIYGILEPDGQRCKKILEEKLPMTEIIINSNQLGCYFNSTYAWWFAFENKRMDFNLFIEEDVILSPDAINLTNWYIDNHSNNPEMMAIILHNETKSNKIDNKICKKYKWFTTFGMGITRDIWRNVYRPNILKDPGGWDFSIYSTIKEIENLHTILPEFSRANHIGRYGTHCSQEFHDSHFRELIINQDIVKKEEFQLVN